MCKCTVHISRSWKWDVSPRWVMFISKKKKDLHHVVNKSIRRMQTHTVVRQRLNSLAKEVWTRYAKQSSTTLCTARSPRHAGRGCSQWEKDWENTAREECFFSVTYGDPAPLFVRHFWQALLCNMRKPCLLTIAECLWRSLRYIIWNSTL